MTTLRKVLIVIQPVMVSLDKQSPDIAAGVNEGEGTFSEMGAGDQGLDVWLCDQRNRSFMPLTIDLSNQLAKRLSDVRKQGVMSELRADGKTQVSAQYENGEIKRIENIVVSSQHSENLKSFSTSRGDNGRGN